MPKALLIVEGARLEPRFFRQLASLYEMQIEIVSFCANIYQLYKKLEEYGFDYDVRQAIYEQNPSDEAKTILSQRFAYTYLIFDCDAHDCGISPGDETPRYLREVVARNYERLDKMINYFTDETDPDRGKLYVNYPMMESFRDADEFFDESYAERTVGFGELCRYKEIVGNRKLAGVHLDKLSRANVNSLILMNLCKLSSMVFGRWQSPRKDYFMMDVQNDVFSAQRRLEGQSLMSVINTSILLPVDYLGVMPTVVSAVGDNGVGQ